jgi:integrase
MSRARGNITRRGKNSWQIKFDDPCDGKRRQRYATVRGTRQDAQKELTRLLGLVDAGTLPPPSKMTVKQCITAWLDGAHGLAPKTAERYWQLAEQQIYPHLGDTALLKLKPKMVQDWHGALLKSGGKDGKPLSAQTVVHAHRVLHRALERCVENETLARNVASVISPPAVEKEEIEILTDAEVATALRQLQGHELHTIASTGLATGMRRGELLAVRWTDCDLDAASMSVKRSLEETKAGLRFKPPKSKRGKRTISLPPSAVAVLREHRRRQLELRLALGLGKPGADALVFCRPDGSPLSPDNLSRDWIRTCKSLGLRKVMFHALRHTHVSALIAAGLDVVAISRRIGHGSPNVTLGTYGHLFRNTDVAAANAIEATLRYGREG